MLEKYLNIDFHSSSEEDIVNITNEISQLNDNDISIILENIIEKFDVNLTFNKNYEIFFSNSKIYSILEFIESNYNL